ncbi:helix-turn-helix transcriptional regulator [Tenacibaculum sp. IB213877]|uniref:helix-turn-helix transcriptional regulator n=1 Tax=Tenacibaculum sp. IB213877 TaxID=3097351 RepID=UPI002A5AE4E1|nr:helix-turn-helix transcriptional regulator [Tenacibaculum sp. IB213877]MDY0779525.1 helix-turn-helix transcriptional regulator [Tenacibaculum sp. IB213877]
MKTINIVTQSTKGFVEQIQQIIGGTFSERWGEHVLSINNDNAKGTITYIMFDWGGSLLIYNIVFFEDIELIIDATQFNPIHFMYATEGHFYHKFKKERKKRKIEQFQPAIITSKEEGYNYTYFDKHIKTHVNSIQINRIKFLKKRLNDASILNQSLYKVFHDEHHEKVFAYIGTFNLKIANLIKQLNVIKQKGMIRIMMKEGIVYQILSAHMIQHTKDLKRKKEAKSSLTKKELNKVRKISQDILKDVSKDYNVDDLALQCAISQAKLQEGFKTLYARTVIEYLRHVRLEEARDLLNNTDYNISQVVYSIGFSSRSYFSKIFKRKYGISPSKFLANKKKGEIREF